MLRPDKPDGTSPRQEGIALGAVARRCVSARRRHERLVSALDTEWNGSVSGSRSLRAARTTP